VKLGILILQKIRALLSQYNDLNFKGEFAVLIEVITYCPAVNNHSYVFTACSDNELTSIINERLSKWEHPELLKKTISILQSVVNINPQVNRDYVKKIDSNYIIIEY
jgi:hypothetical protein